jgi:CheY-like chemotaxis protein
MDPFFTTKPQGKGTGMGLSLVYSAVKAHRGHVELESAPGQGTCVTLRFPCHPEPSGAAPLPGGSAGEPGRSGLRVLVVDDDELIQATVPQLLEALGHRVDTALSGEEALERLAGGLCPDLVILDMNMPGLGGAATLPRLRALRPELPVLLATGRADQEALDLVAADPHARLLAKPFSLDDLRGVLPDAAAPVRVPTGD